MKGTQVFEDMKAIMKLVNDNPGILGTEIIKLIGLTEPGYPESGSQRLARSKNKLVGEVFLQKDVGKTRWFTADYAEENSTPAKIKGKKIKRYDNPEAQDDSETIRLMYLFHRLIQPVTHVN